jgi:predicted nucleic acid-binding protein
VSGAGTSARGVLWDTMFASVLRPGRREVLEAAVAQRGTAYEPLLAAPVVAEVLLGFRSRAPAGPDAAWWEGQVLAGERRFRFVTTSREAVVLAARVRARRPSSPAKARRRDGRKDPERRLSWSRDIELAAIGATSGLPVATRNLRDFALIAGLIEEVAPRLTLELREFVF